VSCSAVLIHRGVARVAQIGNFNQLNANPLANPSMSTKFLLFFIGFNGCNLLARQVVKARLLASSSTRNDGFSASSFFHHLQQVQPQRDFTSIQF
jgi:hypothetical protein